NIGNADITTPDAMAGVRGLGIRILTPNGQEWRSAMIDAPIFAAATPRAFFDFLAVRANKDPDAFKDYRSVPPEILTFVSWVKNHPRTESWSQDRFNSLDSFVFVNRSGVKSFVRWSLVPSTTPVTLSPEELARRDSAFLEEDITRRIAAGPQYW